MAAFDPVLATVAVSRIVPPCVGELVEVLSVVIVADIVLTVRLVTAELLAALFAAPLYVAIMGYVPGAREAVLKVAVAVFAPVAVKATDPELNDPPAKVTLPEGAPTVDVTVAVIVIVWLKPAGFGVSDSVVVVVACSPVPLSVRVNASVALLLMFTVPVTAPIA